MQAHDLQWQSNPDVLSVCDSERHLGHAFRFDAWHAFDATRLNATGNGFHYLGRFDTIVAAKEALADSLGRLMPITKPLVMAAGSRYIC